MRLALVIPLLLALSGCVTIGTYPPGYSGYYARPVVVQDYYGRPVEAIVVERPVVVYSVPVYGYGRSGHRHHRH